MPSMKCYECGKVKRCRMFEVRAGVETLEGQPHAHALDSPEHEAWVQANRKVLIEYLCAPCARELGYA